MSSSVEQMRPRLESQSENAYRQLRSDILNGLFAPNERLRLEALRDRYGVSFSPLREALNQLQAEQLVTSSANRGFRVAAVSIKEMWDTINIRILLETEALTRSIRLGSDDWEAEVVSTFHALDKARRRLDGTSELSREEREAIEVRHQQFHATLLKACDSEVLLRLAAGLYAQTERYRRPWLSRVLPETVAGRVPDDDHRALVDAALARNAQTAAEILRRHLTATGEFIESHQRRQSAAPPGG